MGPSWWVACQVEVEQLCQRGSRQGVLPASQPWASGSLGTCQAAGGSEPMGVHRSGVGPNGARNPFLPSLSSPGSSPEQHTTGPPSPGRSARNKGEQAPESRSVNHTCPAPPWQLCQRMRPAEPKGWEENPACREKGLGEFFRAYCHLQPPSGPSNTLPGSLDQPASRLSDGPTEHSILSSPSLRQKPGAVS